MLSWILTQIGQTNSSTINNAGTNPVFFIESDGKKYITILVQSYEDLPLESRVYYDEKLAQEGAIPGTVSKIDVQEPDHVHPTNIRP